MIDPARMPRPDGERPDRLQSLSGAIVVPPPPKPTLSFPGGVLTAAGKDVPDAAVWRGHRRITLHPPIPQHVDALPGTWLWGGLLYGHFGHFLCESIARLWSLPHVTRLPVRPQGILFIPRFDTEQRDITAWHRSFVTLMGSDLPLRLITRPSRIDQLIVPSPGFGLGPMATGTPRFRQAVAHSFARDVVPEGAEKLYISRSRIGPRRGGLLFETLLETHLAAQGYDIFHPQDHDLYSQIARYKAARHILAAEGSALHLLGLVATAQQNIGIVLRRKSGATQAITQQIQSFSGRAPQIFDAVHRHWMPKTGGRKHMGVAELDFASLQTQLTRAGFLQSCPSWTTPDAIAAQAEVFGARFRRVMDYQPRPV